MVIELLHGEALIAQIPEQFAEVVRVLLQICAALHEVHRYGIVHRDLKPENVMILPDGNIELMDFGLAHYDTSRITREGEILGSMYYLSPEQALGKAVDARTDIYALRLLAYELATGKFCSQACLLAGRNPDIFHLGGFVQEFVPGALLRNQPIPLNAVTDPGALHIRC